MIVNFVANAGNNIHKPNSNGLRMKIKISAVEPSGQEYGSELALLDILTGLDKNKFHAEVIIPKGCSFRKRLDSVNVLGLELLQIDLFKGRNINRPLSYARIILHWIINKPDVIMINQAGILRGMAFCNAFLRRPIICFVSTFEDADHVSYLAAWIYKHVHKIVCNSRETFNKIKNNSLITVSENNHLEKIQVVYYGYVPKKLFSMRPPWKPSNPAHRFVIGILGRICKSKGHDLLIKTLRYLIGKGSNWAPRIDVVFIGDYSQPEKEEMQGLIEQSPIPVEVTGYRQNIALEMSRLHLLLIPSIAEPFGRIVQEAAEAGLPVIASDSGGLGEICKLFNYGKLFKYPDTSHLAKLIEETIDNYELILEEILRTRESFLSNFKFADYINTIQKMITSAYEEHLD